MDGLRALIQTHSRMAMLMCVLALGLRAIVPAGYMIGTQGKAITAYICGDGVMAQSIDIPMKPGTDHDKTPSHGGTACAFAAMVLHAPNAPIFDADDRAAPAHSPPYIAAQRVRIGHGLAAPPPPKTGPPAIL